MRLSVQKGEIQAPLSVKMEFVVLIPTKAYFRDAQYVMVMLSFQSDTGLHTIGIRGSLTDYLFFGTNILICRIFPNILHEIKKMLVRRRGALRGRPPWIHHWVTLSFQNVPLHARYSNVDTD